MTTNIDVGEVSESAIGMTEIVTIRWDWYQNDGRVFSADGGYIASSISDVTRAFLSLGWIVCEPVCVIMQDKISSDVSHELGFDRGNNAAHLVRCELERISD